MDPRSYNRGGSGGRGRGRGRGGSDGGPYRPSVQAVGATRPESTQSGGRSGPVSGRSWANICQPIPLQRPQPQPQPQPQPRPLPDIRQLKISEQKPPSLPESSENRLLPLRRPDSGGTLTDRPIKLLVNHFPVSFNPQTTIIHYNVDIKPEMSPGSRPLTRSIPKSDVRLIMDKFFTDNPDRFPIQMTACDGGKNIFSAVQLPTGQFKAMLTDSETTRSRSYIFTIKFVSELKYSKLNDYFSGNLKHIPRDVLQGMDLVVKDHPSRHRINFGRSTYSKGYRREDDLHCGVAAYRGFQQSLKPTAQGVVLCLDFSVMAFPKRMPVIEFLMEHVWEFQGVNDIRRLMRQVTSALKGLKVNVTHRATNQKFIIAGLTQRNTRELSFTLEDPEGRDPPRQVGLVDYFREKYGKEILYQDIPCLDVGKGDRQNYVPMEFCVLVEGQRYPKELLDRDSGASLKKISLPPPRVRKNAICEMVRAEDGPCGGEVIQNFGMGIDPNMTRLEGRVIAPPDLKLGGPSGRTSNVRVDKDRCQWNLVGRSVLKGIPVERWALLDFSSADCRNKLNPDNFIRNLMARCKNLGIQMKEPLVCRFTDTRAFLDVIRLRQLLDGVMEEAFRKSKGRLQIIICPMAATHEGYKYLKWVSETQVGVVTQCCLSFLANKGNDQYLANLALKINAKLGGNNFELIERLPRFQGEDHVMFIGADVNHPAAHNSSCPSIAAVVATVNWPAANRYAARVCPQDHRTEKIQNFGNMCLELVNMYAQINKVKPKKIVVFRDGVSDGQFDMALNEEMSDLKTAIYVGNYRPTITLVVAQKRHLTRLFPENERDGGPKGNVPPGTVVDTKIVHPWGFDFYLNSHDGGLGTSKPTHYCVLHDDHKFTSDQMQKLCYDLCFTFARCTKPVSLVPPVYYADLVAYRGRMFQEVVMSLQSPSSSSSSHSAASSTISSSFDENFYKLHPALQNVMFFI